MLEFVAGMSHHERKSLQVQASCAWQGDSTQLSNFLRMKKRLVLETLLLKFIQNLFAFVEGCEVGFSLFNFVE